MNTSTVFQKFLAGVSVSAIVLSSVVVAPLASAAKFSDVPSTHWAASHIEKLADLGIVSGNPDGTFRPDATLNRAEFAKIAVELAKNLGIVSSEELAADAPAFSDVPKSAWFHKYVTLAAQNGFVGGYKDASGKSTGMYGPSDTVTRAQAAKVLLLAAGIDESELLDPPSSFPDVNEKDWFYNYVTTAYNYSVLDGYQNGLFGPNDPVTRAQIAKIATLVMEPQVRTPMDDTTDEDTTDEDTTDEDTTDEDTTDTGSNDLGGNPSIDAGDLEVALSADNSVLAPAGSVPLSAFNVPYLYMDVTAGSDEDLLVQQVVVTRRGIGSPQDFDNVNIYLNDTRQGSSRTFTKDANTATFTFAGRPIVIPAGTTHALSVRADLAATGTASANGENFFEIEKPEHFVAAGKDSGGSVDIVGTFPIRGNTMRNIDVKAGSLSVEAGTNPPTTVNVGENQITAGQIRLKESSGQEDILVTGIYLENLGSASAKDISNVTLYDASTKEKLAGPLPLDSSDKVYFDLTTLPDGGYLLGDGDTRRMDIKVDVNDGINQTIRFGLDEASDIVAIGQTYGFGVKVTDSSLGSGEKGFGKVTIKGGKVVFDFQQPETTDIAVDKNDIVLAYLNVSNRGEAVLVRDLNLTLKMTAAATTTGSWASSKSYFKNLELVDPEGKVVSGPVDPTSFSSCTITSGAITGTCSATVKFTDDFNLPTSAEAKKYILRGDTGKDVVEGERYTFNFRPVNAGALTGEFRAEGSTTGDDVAAGDLQDADIVSDEILIEDERLVVTLANTPLSDTVIRGNKTKVLGVNFRAGDAGDIRITTLKFAKSSSVANFSSSDIIEFALLDEEGKIVDTDTISGDETGPTFDQFPAFVIKAGAQKTLYVEANVATAATAGKIIGLQLTVNTSNISAEDVDGDSLASTQLYAGATANSANPINGSATVKFTIQTAGTLQIAIANDTPSAKQVQFGTKGNDVMQIQLDAKNEDVLIDKLVISALDATQSQQISSLHLFDGATEIGAGQPMSTENKAEWNLSGSQKIRVPKNGRKILTVKADFHLGVNDQAIAGRQMQLFLREVEADGSKQDVIPTFGTTTSNVVLGTLSTDIVETGTFAAIRYTSGTPTVGSTIVLTEANGDKEHMTVLGLYTSNLPAGYSAGMKNTELGITNDQLATVTSGNIALVSRQRNQANKKITSANFAVATGDTSVIQPRVISSKFVGYNTLLVISNSSRTFAQSGGPNPSKEDLFEFTVRATSTANAESTIEARLNKLRVTMTGGVKLDDVELRNKGNNENLVAVAPEQHNGTGTSTFTFDLASSTTAQAKDRVFNVGDSSGEKTFIVRAKVDSTGATSNAPLTTLFSISDLGDENSASFADSDVEWEDYISFGTGTRTTAANWVDLPGGDTQVTQTQGRRYDSGSSTLAAPLADMVFDLNAVSVAGKVGGTVNMIEAGDMITLTFNEALTSGQLGGLATGGSLSVAAGVDGSVSVNSGSKVLTIQNVGSFVLGTTVSGDATFASTLSLSSDGKTLVVVLGTRATGADVTITTPAFGIYQILNALTSPDEDGGGSLDTAEMLVVGASGTTPTGQF